MKPITLFLTVIIIISHPIAAVHAQNAPGNYQADCWTLLGDYTEFNIGTSIMVDQEVASITMRETDTEPGNWAHLFALGELNHDRHGRTRKVWVIGRFWAEYTHNKSQVWKAYLLTEGFLRGLLIETGWGTDYYGYNSNAVVEAWSFYDDIDDSNNRIWKQTYYNSPVLMTAFLYSGFKKIEKHIDDRVPARKDNYFDLIPAHTYHMGMQFEIEVYVHAATPTGACSDFYNEDKWTGKQRKVRMDHLELWGCDPSLPPPPQVDAPYTDLYLSGAGPVILIFYDSDSLDVTSGQPERFDVSTHYRPARLDSIELTPNKNRSDTYFTMIQTFDSIPEFTPPPPGKSINYAELSLDGFSKDEVFDVHLWFSLSKDLWEWMNADDYSWISVEEWDDTLSDWLSLTTLYVGQTDSTILYETTASSLPSKFVITLLLPEPHNALPVAKISPTVYFPPPGFEVQFDASGSFDTLGGVISSYNWDFDVDGVDDDFGINVYHAFPDSETVFPVRLVVVDNEGAKVQNFSFISTTTPTGAGEVDSPSSDYSALDQNYPNPFNPMTTISYTIGNDCTVVLEIFDVAGHRIVELVNEYQKAGSKIFRWDAKDSQGNHIASSVYFYRLKAGKQVMTRKMVLLK